MATRPEERMTDPDMNPADLWMEESHGPAHWNDCAADAG